MYALVEKGLQIVFIIDCCCAALFAFPPKYTSFLSKRRDDLSVKLYACGVKVNFYVIKYLIQVSQVLGWADTLCAL